MFNKTLYFSEKLNIYARSNAHSQILIDALWIIASVGEWIGYQ